MPCQVSGPGVCPDLVVRHLAFVIEVEVVHELLVPPAALADAFYPLELRAALAGDLCRLRVDYPLTCVCTPSSDRGLCDYLGGERLTEAHAVVGDIVLQKCEVRFDRVGSTSSPECSSQKRGEEGLAVLVCGDLMGHREMRKELWQS